VGFVVKKNLSHGGYMSAVVYKEGDISARRCGLEVYILLFSCTPQIRVTEQQQKQKEMGPMEERSNPSSF
jgi:hypothetical protein